MQISCVDPKLNFIQMKIDYNQKLEMHGLSLRVNLRVIVYMYYIILYQNVFRLSPTWNESDADSVTQNTQAAFEDASILTATFWQSLVQACMLQDFF